MAEQTWYITVKVTADPETFQDRDDEPLLNCIRDEIVAGLQERGAEAEIVDIGDTLTDGEIVARRFNWQ